MAQDNLNSQTTDGDIYEKWLEKSMQEANRELIRLRGQEARWYSYTLGHRTFDLAVGDLFGKNNIVLCLPACLYIAGPPRWPNQRIEIFRNRDHSHMRWNF